MKMNAYKKFHIFASMYVIKIYVTDLVLKDKNAQDWKSFSFSSRIASLKNTF